MQTQKSIYIYSFLMLSLFSCQKEDQASNTVQQNSATVPDIYKKIYGATSITADASFVYVKTNGLPDHKSVYYNTANALYESFPGLLLREPISPKIQIQ